MKVILNGMAIGNRKWWCGSVDSPTEADEDVFGSLLLILIEVVVISNENNQQKQQATEPMNPGVV